MEYVEHRSGYGLARRHIDQRAWQAGGRSLVRARRARWLYGLHQNDVRLPVASISSLL